MNENEFSELMTPSKKKGFFKFLVSKIFSKKNKTREETKTYYSEIIKNLNREEPNYKNIVKCAELCERGSKLTREKLITQNKLEILAKEITELSYYENLTAEDIEHLKDLLDRYTGLTKDRRALRDQISVFDKSLVKMEKLEEDAKQVINNVRDAEKKVRYLKNDMLYIESEKVELEYERESLFFARRFARRLGIVLVFLLGFSSIALFSFAILMNVDVFYPLVGIGLVSMLTLPFIYSFSSKAKRELKLNIRKQNRAVTLFNRKKNVYNHYVNFLKFVYVKYGVNNAEKLSQNLKDYEHYKYIIGRYDSIRDLLGKTETQIDFFIRDNNMVNSSISVDAFSKSTNVEEKRRYFLELKQEQNSLISRYNSLTSDLEKISEEIQKLNDNTTKDITNLVNHYLAEVKRFEDTIPKVESLLELESEN